jgi:hypothetical protein
MKGLPCGLKPVHIVVHRLCLNVSLFLNIGNGYVFLRYCNYIETLVLVGSCHFVKKIYKMTVYRCVYTGAISRAISH